MKKSAPKLTNLAASPATVEVRPPAKQNREHSHSPLAPSPLPADILAVLRAIVANLDATSLFGDEREQTNARAVKAGIVLALVEILPMDQLKRVLLDWEIDEVTFGELLDLAGFAAGDTHRQKIIEA